MDKRFYSRKLYGLVHSMKKCSEILVRVGIVNKIKKLLRVVKAIAQCYIGPDNIADKVAGGTSGAQGDNEKPYFEFR
jgi:hypothetical protein